MLEWVAFQRDLPNPGIEPRSPALQADSEPQGKPYILGNQELSPKLRALYAQIQSTYVDYGTKLTGYLAGSQRKNLWVAFLNGHRPLGVASFLGYSLDVVLLTVLSPAPKSVPDRMLHLFVESIDYSFSPIALQVSEVPSLSAFKTASGTVNALTVGSVRSPWWGKAS